MKLSVELTDFYLDEEEDIIPALKHHIIAECVNKITKSIQDKVDKVIDKAVKDAINDTMNSVIKEKVEEFVKSGNVSGTYSHDKPISIEEWLGKQFSSTSYNSLKATVQTLAKNHVDNLKKQYDLQFATHIVNRMRENEMLKPDIANMLLSEPKGN